MITRRIFLQAIAATVIVPALPSLATAAEQQYILIYWRKVNGVWEWVQEALLLPIDEDVNDIAVTVIGDVFSQGSQSLAMVRVAAFDECDQDALNAVKELEYQLLMHHETEDMMVQNGVLYCAAALDNGVAVFPANGDKNSITKIGRIFDV